MKLTNPHQDRSILANITPDSVEDGATAKPLEGKWYEIPPGETVDVEDYVVASTLVEYGAVARPDELAAARDLWAERNRLENSRTASATASEGKILTRQQATVDVATGTTEGGELKGDALAAAVKAANEAGAEIKSSASADEKREALAAWQASRGSSSPVNPDRFKVDDDGELVLDDDGQPIPLEPAAGDPASENPVDGVVSNPEDVDGEDDGEAQVDGQDDDDEDSEES